jgi:hypothetical protein
MRYVFRIGLAFALGLALMAGCSDETGFPCTEQGIRDAIAEGGGPYTFACNGPTTVTTEAEIVINNDVILDGESNLTVDGRDHPSDQRVFSVPEGVTAELHRVTVTNGGGLDGGGGIVNEGTLTILSSVISNNWSSPTPDFFPAHGAGIRNEGEMTTINSNVSNNVGYHASGGGISNGCSATLTLMNSTVSRNDSQVDGPGRGGGIYNLGEMTIINSTVSENMASGLHGSSGGGIFSSGWMSLTNTTVSSNTADSADAIEIGSYRGSCPYRDAYVEIAHTLVDGDCDKYAEDGSNVTWVSNGYNIESPGNTCDFGRGTDQPGKTPEELNLGELADNGGPTMTHALGAGSVAIDQIPEAACEVETDQRGLPRPETGGTTCDVGSVEVQPAP